MSFVKSLAEKVSGAVKGFVTGLTAPLVSKYVGSPIRTGLAAVGGYLVAEGLAEPDTVGAAVQANYELAIGIITALVAQGASLFEKAKRE